MPEIKFVYPWTKGTEAEAHEDMRKLTIEEQAKLQKATKNRRSPHYKRSYTFQPSISVSATDGNRRVLTVTNSYKSR